MLESLKIWPLLDGYRGRPPANIEKLIEVMIRLSYLAADYPEITELDINPLLVGPADVVALDARIVIDKELVGKKIEPYSHLALRPYPEKYVKTAALRDKTHGYASPDQAGGRAALDGAARQLLERIDLPSFPLLLPVGLARGGDPLLLYRLRPRNRDRGRDQPMGTGGN